MSELHELGVAEASKAIAAKMLSPSELVEALLARIDKLNPKVNAFIHLTTEAARAAAKTATDAVAAGRSQGRLHGVPFAIKDIYDTAGIPTTTPNA